MRVHFFYLFIVILLTVTSFPGLSQEVRSETAPASALLDTLKMRGVIFGDFMKKPEIDLSNEQAIIFLQRRLLTKYWKDSQDPLRQALNQLVFEASHHPYDSAEQYLRQYPFDSLNVSWDKFFIWEPLRLKIPVTTHRESHLPVDTLQVADSALSVMVADSVPSALINKGVHISELVPFTLWKDTTILVVIDTLHHVTSDNPQFPYTYYTEPFQADSTQAAVRKLMEYLQARDSTMIYFTGTSNVVTPIWLNSKADVMKRYWLRNELDDSVTVWLGAVSRNTIGLFLEHGLSFRRPVMQGNYSEARIEVKEIDRSKLLEVQKIVVKQQFWKYRAEAAFALNQAALSNWVKGGENSISTSTDITGYADYSNKARKVTSNNFARLKYGLIKSGESGVRKNLDLLETNSKLNHKAFGKFDFSAIMLFKTQIDRGYTYGKDTVLVSKFMSPATLTAGIGLDYKPNKTTSFNLSPFSYKGTFVTDTLRIDQTKYGVAKDRKSKHEPGASLMISHEFNPAKTVKIINRVQLFTNYINNPQNIDIDWEMILTANLNWFTDVRFNTHLIFDNDTKTTVYDDKKNPVPGPDGKPKKTARIQFKELLGFSFIFRF